MPTAYSVDLCVRVADYYNLSKSCEETAEVFNVSEYFVKSLVKGRSVEGTLVPWPHGGNQQAL